MNWYYAKGNDRFGPITLEALVGAAMSGVLGPSDLVWSDGMPSWVEANDMPDLFSTESPHPLLARIGGPDYLQQFAQADGKSIVVSSGAVLPQRCIKSNMPLSHADMIRKDFYWCNPVWLLLFLISGLLLIIVYLVARKRCTLTYGLDPSIRRRYRNRMIVKSIIAVGLFFAIPFSAATNSTPLITAVVISFLVSIIALFIGNSPLKVKTCVAERFWIKGCCPEFLAQLPSLHPSVD